MKRLGLAIFFLLAAAVLARADINTGFENPPIFASPSGFVLSNQDGWFLPSVANSTDFYAFTYLKNQYGFPPNPNPISGAQFVAGAGTSTLSARAQRSENFNQADVWTLSVDVAPKYVGTLPASNNMGSFSLQERPAQRTFIGLMTWMDVQTAASWQLGYQIYNAGGVLTTAPAGESAGPQWQNLQANHWYRVSTTFSLTLNRILSVSIKDLTTGVTASAQPNDWFLAGGNQQPPILPPPTGVRLFTGAGNPGNMVAWDNLDVCPLQITDITPESGNTGTLVQIDGCGFGIDKDALSVAVTSFSGTGVPLTVESVTDTRIMARLGPVPPGAQMGQIAVTKGVGRRGINVPFNDDVIPEDNLQVHEWKGPGPRVLSSEFFSPLPSGPPLGQTWLIGQRNGLGQFELIASGNWRPNSKLRVICKFHDTVGGDAGDVEGLEIRLRCGGNSQYLAERIRDAAQTAFASHGINTTGSIQLIGVNTWRVTLDLRDGVGTLIPCDFGVFTVVVNEPSLVNPFAIGPVTAFYQAFMTQVALTARINNIDLTGEDGGTISPNIPTPVGVNASTLPIVLDVIGESFTARSWGTLNGVTANQLLGTARLSRVGAALDINASFAGVGSANTRLEVWYNAGLNGSMTRPNGQMGLVTSAGSGLPNIIRCGARPQIGPAAPFIWIDFDRPVTVTPTGGPPATGNQVRLIAVAPPNIATNIQAFDLAAGLADPSDVGQAVILNSYEGGICYANCDGSTQPPRLTPNDFQCFLNAFAAGNPRANCDGSTAATALTPNDFQCFLNEFAGGCP